ncbi:hypothetical protein BIV57_00470 [Mangrovactinospora gilvigrisea]|uniref:Uncharacterized protein n=2 Tax=Mangrovactinospora gilvigrisea TaxID=1428644 RepID=A0A1J7BKY1_9ACTN|nr:hypothetical protein BIV57_00470 [Mangrovactinospora gilvigrisea]
MCLRCYKTARKVGGAAHARRIWDQQQSIGRPDGHGRFGILDADQDGQQVLCHECGRWVRGLGAHAWMAHGISAADYRAAHGLARGQSLSAPATRATQSQLARARVGSAGWRRLEAARDPHAAAAARDFTTPMAAATRRDAAPRAARNGEAARKGRVRVCPVCGARWCPLPGGYQRTTCGATDCLRTLAARNARAAAQRRTPPIDQDRAARLQDARGEALVAEARKVHGAGHSLAQIAAVLGIGLATAHRLVTGGAVPRAYRTPPATRDAGTRRKENPASAAADQG